MSGKPTVVIVPGAWHLPNSFSLLITELTQRGYPCEALRNPSAGANPTDTNFFDDVSNLQKKLRTLLDSGRDVILVSHSYGGTVVAHALKDEAQLGEMQSNGKILSLVYIAAFALKPGETVLEFNKPVDREVWSPLVDGVLPPPEAELFYSDMPQVNQYKWVKTLLHQPESVFMVPAEGEPWKFLPSMYILTEHDKIVYPWRQELMVENMGNDVQVVRLNSGHSPFLSMPGKVANLFERAEAFGREKLKAAAAVEQ